MGSRLLKQDLDTLLTATPHLWGALRGSRVFITGGTGFVGCWLLEVLTWVRCQSGIDIELLVLTRNPAAFAQKAPHLALDPAVTLQAGDVRDFDFPTGRFTHVIHCAAPVVAGGAPKDRKVLSETGEVIVEGTRRVLEFARQAGVAKMLYVSSGAIYGPQPPGTDALPESYEAYGESRLRISGYGAAKRKAETLCEQYACVTDFDVTIARCFAFVGPYLTLSSGLAAADFIRQVLADGPIIVEGTGEAVRSYMYAADLTEWLLTILVRGSPCRPYNVGSEIPVTIAELATRMAALTSPAQQVKILRSHHGEVSSQRYVPSTNRAREELGLVCRTSLDDALQRTLDWYMKGNFGAV